MEDEKKIDKKTKIIENLEEKAEREVREKKTELEKLVKDPKKLLGNKLYLAYQSQNTFRKVKGRDERRYSVLDEPINDCLITYFHNTDKLTLDEETIKYNAEVFMDSSKIGKNVDGEYQWQRFDRDEVEDKIDLAWTFYEEEKNGHSAELMKKANSNEALPVDENYVKPPPNHPVNRPDILIIIHIELDKKLIREYANRLVVFLAALSAWLLRHPVGIAGLGASSIGKSFTIGRVLMHFPFVDSGINISPEKRMKLMNKPLLWELHDTTAASLFRTESSLFNRKIIYYGERPNAEKTISSEDEKTARFLRQLASNGSIGKLLLEQAPGSQKWVSVYYKIEAEISLILESAESIEEQELNRTLPLSFDESEEQTKLISQFVGEEKGKPFDRVIQERSEPSKIIQEIISHIPANFFLHMDYENPYYKEITAIVLKMYNFAIHTRRMIGYVFGLIEVITKLHIKSRGHVSDHRTKTGYKIVSTAEDNLIGLMLLWNSMEQSVTSTTTGDYYFLGLIKIALSERKVTLLKNPKKFNAKGEVQWQEEGEWWTINKMRDIIKKSKGNLIKHLIKLQEMGYVKSKKMGSSDKSGWKYSITEKDESSVSLSPTDFLNFFTPELYRNDLRLGAVRFPRGKPIEIIFPNMPVFDFFKSVLPLTPVHNNIIYYIGVQENFCGYDQGNISNEKNMFSLDHTPDFRTAINQRQIWYIMKQSELDLAVGQFQTDSPDNSLKNDSQSPGTKHFESPEQTYVRQLKVEMRRLAKLDGNGKIRKGDLIKFTSTKGMMADILEKTLEKWSLEGEIQEPFPNIYKLPE